MTELTHQEARTRVGDSVRDLCAIVGIDHAESMIKIHIDANGLVIEVGDMHGKIPLNRTVKLVGPVIYRKKIEEAPETLIDSTNLYCAGSQDHDHEFEPFPLHGRLIQKCKFCYVLKYVNPDVEAAERAEAGLDKTPTDWVAKSIADAEAAGRPLDQGA